MSEVFQGKEGHIGGWFILTVLGILTLFVHVRHLADTGITDLVVVFFNVFFPALISLALVGAAGWLATKQFTGSEAMRIGGWTLLGFLLITILVGAMMMYVLSQFPNQNLVNITMTTGSAGGIMGFILGVYDVHTARSRQQIREERDRAERLNQQITVLNRVFRHDIRQELTVLKGSATQLQEAEEKNEDIIERLHDHIDEVGKINSQIRELQSTIDYATKTSELNLHNTLQEARTSVLTKNPDTSITISGDTDVTVHASQQLHVAFSNILENSIEHTETNEIRVYVEPKPNEDLVDVRFIDDGPGIPPHELAVIRTGEETQLQHSSGLGLWLVNWIVQESDGDLEIMSIDSGSEVTITLEAVRSGSGNSFGFFQ